MKKHRNFFFFYSLWLVALTGIFVVFGEDSADEYIKADNQICTVADDLMPRTTKAYDKKTCNLKDL